MDKEKKGGMSVNIRMRVKMKVTMRMKKGGRELEAAYV